MFFSLRSTFISAVSITDIPHSICCIGICKYTCAASYQSTTALLFSLYNDYLKTTDALLLLYTCSGSLSPLPTLIFLTKSQAFSASEFSNIKLVEKPCSKIDNNAICLLTKYHVQT